MQINIRRYVSNPVPPVPKPPVHVYDGKYQSRTAKETADLQNGAALEVYRMRLQSRVDFVESEAVKAETLKAIDDANDLINYARLRAGGDPLKAHVFAPIIEFAIQNNLNRVSRSHTYDMW
ncbi:hypothetical protein ACFU44_13965 [Nocardia rhizosphaerihabitans]|uniref:hypothetical protein n=1 Tax=Nocardia rhizosphaerihabitans TaxID=1691570 RepID=UPI003670D3BA